MASEATIFLPTIMENLFGEGMSAVKEAGTDHSSFILGNGKTVDIPQAGTHGSITQGNTDYPVDIEERTDGDLTYNLTNVEIEPIRNGRWQEDTSSYNRMMSLINDATKGLSYYAARVIFGTWYHKTAGQFVETTGSTGYVSQAPNSTEEVKSLTIADVIKAALILDKQGFSRINDRMLILNASMYNSLFNDVDAGDYLNFASRNLQTGLIENLHGFKLRMVSDVVNLNSIGSTVKDPDATGTTADISAGLAVVKSAASFAVGDPYIHWEADSAPNYGAVLSADIFVGGKYARTDKKGIVPILEDAV